VLQRSSPIFAALGDVTRLHVVSRLAEEGPLSIRELTSGAAVTRQAVTKHLDVLAAAGLVTDARQGRERIWELRTPRLDEARRLLDTLAAERASALERLRASAENE
jgi:DNA-binding transcriptional ArsR family regulator